MIPFIRLPCRTPGQDARDQSFRPVVIAAVLGLLLLFQVGLVLWVFVKQW